MTHYFLEGDLTDLSHRIEEVGQKIREFGKEMGRSCKEGAETYHDNFAFEDGERQQRMWGSELKKLVSIKNRARVISVPSSNIEVAVGKRVTFRDEKTLEVRSYVIGSYLILTATKDRISYDSQLGRILVGNAVGEICEGFIAGKKTLLKILSIE
jgi:transcription elongation GreA/GreB family factor